MHKTKEEMVNPVEVRIPFPGFYESLLSSIIEDFEREEAESKAQQFLPADKQNELRDVLFEQLCRGTFMGYRRAEHAICEEYAESFAHQMKGLTGTDIRYSFSIMTSPKEYNFVTDQLFLFVEREDLMAILEKVRGDLLDEEAVRMFTSRDGFISFYSSDVDSWGTPDTWDHNQWYCALVATQDLDPKQSFAWRDCEWYYYDINGYELLTNFFDYDKFHASAKAEAAKLGMSEALERTEDTPPCDASTNS